GCGDGRQLSRCESTAPPWRADDRAGPAPPNARRRDALLLARRYMVVGAYRSVPLARYVPDAHCRPGQEGLLSRSDRGRARTGVRAFFAADGERGWPAVAGSW